MYFLVIGNPIIAARAVAAGKTTSPEIVIEFSISDENTMDFVSAVIRQGQESVSGNTRIVRVFPITMTEASYGWF